MTVQREQTAKHTSVTGRWTENLRHDLPAGLVVFFVALPLCLGIAFASGAPVLAGLITGIVGGLVVATISRSELSVSGPAAGLFVICDSGIQELGSYEAFVVAVILAGFFQLVLGFLRAGVIAYYVPSSVIKGMLAGIGVVLILKQIPHAFGYSADFEGDVFFGELNGHNSLTAIKYALGHVDVLSTVMSVLGLGLLVMWQRSQRLQQLRLLPGPLVAIVIGVGLNALAKSFAPELAVGGELLVQVPKFGGLSELKSQINAPDFSILQDIRVYKIAAVVAIVASIETLLCVEAIDKLDPLKRCTPTSHELKAQGVGNIVAGFLGGLPLTAVIVRGSANVHSGGRSWVSAFFHGVLLLVSVFTIPNLLNLIPLASLAAILLHIGYKLAPLELFATMWRQGRVAALPFAATVAGIVFTDLLTGVLVGLAIGIFFVLRSHASAPYYLHEQSSKTEGGCLHRRIELAENVSFLNKAALNELLHSLPEEAHVELDARRTRHLDHDALDVIDEFIKSAPIRGITVVCRGLDELLVEHGFKRATS